MSIAYMPFAVIINLQPLPAKVPFTIISIAAINLVVAEITKKHIMKKL